MEELTRRATYSGNVVDQRVIKRDRQQYGCMTCDGRYVTGGWDGWHGMLDFVSPFLRWH